MTWTELHAKLLTAAFEKVLGRPEKGAMAFVRCLTPDVIEAMARDNNFSPAGWLVHRVADSGDAKRTITADTAVELREAKDDAVLLLVDTTRAGAGMDGIYSAALQVDEAALFKEAARLGGREVTRKLSRQSREYAEQAIKKARGFGRRLSISPWAEFDFLVRVAGDAGQAGELLHILGLWPAAEMDELGHADALATSQLFVERLLGREVAGLGPAQRIEAVRLVNPSPDQRCDLERFLRSAATKPIIEALPELADKKHLWIGALKVEGASETIQSIELVPWRTRTGRIVRSSGLIEGDTSNDPPILILNPEAEKSGDYSKLAVRWKVRPPNLEKAAITYHVAIVTDMEEELATRDATHSGRRQEKCSFTSDDFSMLDEDMLVSAKVVLSVIGNETTVAQESEEFVIRFGHPPRREPSAVGKRVRAFSEGLIELNDREAVSALAGSTPPFPEDGKGFVSLRLPEAGKSFRVFRPSLIREVEEQWIDQKGSIGHFRVRVRASGVRASSAEFVPFAFRDSPPEGTDQSLWDRVTNASRRMAERFAACGGGVGQIYDEKAKTFDTVVREYLLAWAALLEQRDPSLALANTVEVQSLSGRTIGLIVLPSHPLRVAWHVAYDNLVLHAAFEEGVRPREIHKEFSTLDGAMFPPFLPGLEKGSSFVFADTLGFHAVGMVPDNDKEPKAAVAILARALGESETADSVPTVGRQSAEVLGAEIGKYIGCHNVPRELHIHALRPGDGLTVARALGRVLESLREGGGEEEAGEGGERRAPSFVLELYPSPEQRGVAGRFIAEARQKRRTGAGSPLAEDRWMLESLSLPGGVNLPKLRWARKAEQEPRAPAHLAVAFDTFESQVVADEQFQLGSSRPLFAFGMLSFFERKYTCSPSPLWCGVVPASTEGEKHPSDRTHSDRLVRLQQVVQRCVSRNLGGDEDVAILRTEISPEKARSLRQLHHLCDWVITLDRNAGIEYFDSPRDDREIYDAYVIDCVPEREDLGCLQLITSTSSLDEVRDLLDGALDQMGLSQSLRNAEFLMEHLKALSGRLAIRLTGQKAPTSELIALALSHANCAQTSKTHDCWTPLDGGFLIPADDVRDLLPPLGRPKRENGGRESRPDLIYVSTAPRKGLLFRFVEVKYRRHLRAARGPETLEGVRHQVESLRKRWDEWYSNQGVPASLWAIRRAKLARVLRFYADKAHRHWLPGEQYQSLKAEIDRMVEKGGDYTFAEAEAGDRGWVFCPDYGGLSPLEISPAGWDTRVFLFGPALLPDADARRDSLLSSLAPVQARSERAHSEPAPGDDSRPAAGAAAGPTSAERPAMTPSQPFDGGPAAADDDPSICVGTDLLSSTEVRWPLTVKGNPHLLVTGLPGMGKTTCLINLCRQMLEARVRPIVFSYHQDIDERLQEAVGSARFIDFQGLGFNPLHVIDRRSPRAFLDVAGALRDIFVAIFPELGDIQGERIRRAIKESFIEMGWGGEGGDVDNWKEPPFGRFVEILRADPRPDRGLRTLLVRLEELSDYGFFELAESYESLWESDQPVVIRIHGTQNDNLQKAFASLVFYGLYKDMFCRGPQTRITHAVIFDEAHRAARLRLIPTMAKECRKYGISLVLASQEARDFNASVFSAIANYLVLRLTDADAKALVRNVARSDQERVLVDKIKQMERFRAVYFSERRRKPALVALPA